MASFLSLSLSLSLCCGSLFSLPSTHLSRGSSFRQTNLSSQSVVAFSPSCLVFSTGGHFSLPSSPLARWSYSCHAISRRDSTLSHVLTDRMNNNYIFRVYTYFVIILDFPQIHFTKVGSHSSDHRWKLDPHALCKADKLKLKSNIKTLRILIPCL